MHLPRFNFALLDPLPIVREFTYISACVILTLLLWAKDDAINACYKRNAHLQTQVTPNER